MNDSDLESEVKAFCEQYNVHPHSLEADAYLDELKNECDDDWHYSDYGDLCPTCRGKARLIDYVCPNPNCRVPWSLC